MGVARRNLIRLATPILQSQLPQTVIAANEQRCALAVRYPRGSPSPRVAMMFR